MDGAIRPAGPARVFRWLFHRWRPRGYMRLCSWGATLIPSMRRVEVPHGGGVLHLDLRLVDHQTIFLDGGVVWEALERDAVLHLVREGQTAVDVGANLGVFTTLLADRVGPGGRVVAYEPNAGPLLANVARPQVVLRPFPVSDRPGPVGFRFERSTALSRIVGDSERRAGDRETWAVGLDEDLERLGIPSVDFLKIDVEGHEDAVFRSAERLLRREPRPIVMFEWIPGFRSRAHESSIEALGRIGGSDWRLFRAGWDRPTEEMSVGAMPDHPANVFAFPPEKGESASSFLDLARRP